MRDFVKASDVKEDFFYEQCSMEIWNRDDPQRIYSAPAKSVERKETELKITFDDIGFTADCVMHCFRVIGADGLPIKEDDLEPPANVGPNTAIRLFYEMFWDYEET